MRQTEESITRIKKNLAEMWILVQGQVEKSADALLNNNKESAHEVLNREKLVDTYELLIDKECENFFALLNPVAIDLRLVVSILKINYELERIGDFAETICQFVLKKDTDPLPADLLTDLRLREMTDTVVGMLKQCKQALAKEDAVSAGNVFAKDNLLDEINAASTGVIVKYMKAHPETMTDCLHLSAAVRRLERIGDHTANIAENIIFYLEAKVLKHLNSHPDQE